ncbi:MAG: hypothetical protein QF619_12200 [Candidatus Binatia bacterium]|nr:hypothetical protein [Candidatus Binatia bacterium]
MITLKDIEAAHDLPDLMFEFPVTVEVVVPDFQGLLLGNHSPRLTRVFQESYFTQGVSLDPTGSRIAVTPAVICSRTVAPDGGRAESVRYPDQQVTGLTASASHHRFNSHCKFWTVRLGSSCPAMVLNRIPPMPFFDACLARARASCCPLWA